MGLAFFLASCASRTFDNPLDPESGAVQVRSTYDAPGSQPAGLNFEDEELWLIEQGNNRLYRIFARDGRVERSLSLENGPFFGVVSDGSFLWVTQAGQGSLLRIDPTSGQLLQQPLPSPGGDPRGVAFDGNLLWVLDGTERVLGQVDPVQGPIGQLFPTPSLGSPGGLAFRGEELWAIDQRDARLVQLALDGSEIRAFSVPGGSAVGLATDGNLFYVSDRSGRIQVLEIRESEGS